MDQIFSEIADYASTFHQPSEEAWHNARLCLADSLGCAILALQFPECTKLLGPVIPKTLVPGGSRVPGTAYVLDPIRAAFNIGTMIRWLDFNDTWLAAEWGHPSDNLGGLLAVMDFVSQQRISQGERPLTVKDLLLAMIKAHEIQGILALNISFNRIGFDHVILVKIATAAVTAQLLGATYPQLCSAISNAWIDAGPLRTYRHFPNTGSRKSWAAGDATSRGVQFAWMAKQGEMGYPSGLTAPKWGVIDVLFKGHPLTLERPLGSYVMENILFKIAFPAEFHAQTAVECAFKLHPEIIGRLEEIEKIEIRTHESALRIIDKTGKLSNPADRDHCLQYMVAVALLHGNLAAKHYEEKTAQDPRIDHLRSKMHLSEHPAYTKDYLDPDKRSIANDLTIYFKDGQKTSTINIEYPLGHRKRRQEALPLLFEKFQDNLSLLFKGEEIHAFIELFQHPEKIDNLSVQDFVSLFCRPS